VKARARCKVKKNTRGLLRDRTKKDLGNIKSGSRKREKRSAEACQKNPSQVQGRGGRGGAVEK